MGSREKDIGFQRLIPLKGSGLPKTNGDSRSSSPDDSPGGAPSSARHTGKEVIQFTICYMFCLYAMVIFSQLFSGLNRTMILFV